MHVSCCTFVLLLCTLVPVFGTGEHPPKPPFWKPPFANQQPKGPTLKKSILAIPPTPDRGPNHPRGPNDQKKKKKIDPDRNFWSRSKFLIFKLENFNLDVSISAQKIGPRWVARSKISFSLEIVNPDRNLEFFWSLGPLGCDSRRKFKGQHDRGNRTESLWEGICLWEGLWEALWEGGFSEIFQRFLEVFRGF